MDTPIPHRTDDNQNARQIEREIQQRMVGYIAGAFGLVAGLAWNDAIKSVIEYVYPLQSDSVSAKVIYALIVSVIVIFVTVYLTKLFTPPENK